LVTKRKRNVPEGLKQIFPDRFAEAGQRKTTGVHNEGRGPDAEPNEIWCAQCGANIPDFTKLTECWNCNSNNFLGAELAPRRK